MKMLKLGFDPRKYFRDQHWSALLPGVLPREDIHLVGRDSEHGVQWVLDRIEERLVEEIRHSLAETSAGLESVAEAERILEATDKFEASTIEQRLRKDAPVGALKS
ncbi:MAG: hypothetical protein JWN63_230 [Candidatus Acidoferrum typicum]|nr:hypothetical protein [Candidatus Acidoferrum typicum]